MKVQLAHNASTIFRTDLELRKSSCHSSVLRKLAERNLPYQLAQADQVVSAQGSGRAPPPTASALGVLLGLL